MKVFYQCFGRAHTSIVSAHLHLGHLKPGNPPSVDQIMALPFFDQAEEGDFGRPLFFGYDEAGHQVYALGLAGATRPGLAALGSFFHLVESDEPLVIDTLSGLGITARIGGGLSRQFGLVSVGRPMAAFGVRKIYAKLVETVDSVKRFLEEATD